MNTWSRHEIGHDSPQAMARVLALVVSHDSRVKASEREMLDPLGAFERIGVDADDFDEYVEHGSIDTAARHRAGSAAFLGWRDIEHIEQALSGVQEPSHRLMLCRLAAGVITADGRVSDIERLAFQHMCNRWGYTSSDIARAIREDRSYGSRGPQLLS